MGIYGAYGTYRTYETYNSHRPHRSYSETYRNLILGPPGADHQHQNVCGRRGAAADHVLFNFIRDHIFDPLAEVAPHCHSLIAVTMEERATRSGLTPNAQLRCRVMICPPRVETRI